MKTLYYAYVMSHLEFGMLVWDPITKTQTEAIEKIQRYFLKVLYYRTFQYFQYYPTDVDYTELMAGFEVDSLKFRRRCALLLWLRELVREGGRTIDGNLLQHIAFRVPRPGSKAVNLFYEPPAPARSCLSQRNAEQRASGLYNEVLRQEGGSESALDMFWPSRRDYTDSTVLQNKKFNARKNGQWIVIAGSPYNNPTWRIFKINS